MLVTVSEMIWILCVPATLAPETLHSALTMYLSVLCVSLKKTVIYL
jgi:hypothetical protein